jgi:hypothetical protein
MRSWLAVGTGVLGLSALLVGGCSSTPAPYPDANSFCEAVANAECQTNGVLAACNVSASDCVLARQAACVTKSNAAVTTGTRVYTSASAPACISALNAVYSPAASTSAFSVSYSTIQALEQTCDEEVFPGTVPLKEACKTNFDCAQGATPANGTAPGVVCSPVEPGSAVTECAMSTSVTTGMPCANFGSVCTDPGTYCTGVPATCQQGAQVGDSCTAEKGCASDAFCQIDAGAKSG